MKSITCPRCSSDALYRYGRTHTGKQRYLCLICRRQFSLGATRKEVRNKPACPACGKRMHLYMRGNGVIRFRCSDYPECRTYLKVTQEQSAGHGP